MPSTRTPLSSSADPMLLPSSPMERGGGWDGRLMQPGPCAQRQPDGGAGSSWLLRPQVPCRRCHTCYPNPGSPGDIVGVALLLFAGCVHLPFGLAPLPNTPQLASWEARSALLGAEYLLRVPGGECPQILLESGSLASLSPSDARGSCCLNPTYR